MVNKINISIYAIVGNSICVSPEDGDKVFKQLKMALLEEKQIDISFINVEILTSTFLDTAIGKLYDEFDEDKIKDNLSVSDISNGDKLLLKRIVDTAKVYYKNPDQFEDSINEIMENY